jgi:hypothetical protein
MKGNQDAQSRQYKTARMSMPYHGAQSSNICWLQPLLSLTTFSLQFCADSIAYWAPVVNTVP